jgi:hypothetical protein
VKAPATPAQTIAGLPGGALYEAANGSLTNKPHNPFLVGTVSFSIAAPLVTPTTQVESATFRFGTSYEKYPFIGECVWGCGGDTPVPEPSAFALFVAGGILFGGLAFRRRASRS